VQLPGDPQYPFTHEGEQTAKNKQYQIYYLPNINRTIYVLNIQNRCIEHHTYNQEIHIDMNYLKKRFYKQTCSNRV